MSSVSPSGPVLSQSSIWVKPLVTEVTSFGPSPIDDRTTPPTITTTAAPITSSASTMESTLGRKRCSRFISGWAQAVMSSAKNSAKTTGKMTSRTYPATTRPAMMMRTRQVIPAVRRSVPGTPAPDPLSDAAWTLMVRT